ncbi:MAG: hypothetical protein CM1200mP30_18320 [Pseudomonadota bacterium]|nr:MAG: hypothetical protein CM1200mP30_18320 [Pseudomonadota bacterium]
MQWPELIHKVEMLCITNQAAIPRGDLNPDVFGQITIKCTGTQNPEHTLTDNIFVHIILMEKQQDDSPVPCLCRKPGTQMLEQASSEHDFVQEEAVFIGDTTTDFAAAGEWGDMSIGFVPVLQEKTVKCPRPDYWRDLWSAVDFLLKKTAY